LVLPADLLYAIQFFCQYELMQKHAMESWLQKKDFPTLVRADAEIVKLCTPAELDAAFSEQALLAGVAQIYARFKA
jgi:hypothetical protein